MQSIDKVISIEDKLGFKLPEKYKQFLLDEASHSQYVLKHFDRILPDGWKTDGRVDGVITVDNFWRFNQNREHLEGLQTHFEHPRSYVEVEYLYVIMEGSGTVCMAMEGMHKGKIYSADNGDFGIVFQADSLDKFLQSLYKYKP